MAHLTLPTVTGLQLSLHMNGRRNVCAFLTQQTATGPIDLAYATGELASVRVVPTGLDRLHQIRIGSTDFVLRTDQAERAREWLHAHGVVTTDGQSALEKARARVEPAPEVEPEPEFTRGQYVYYHPVIGGVHDGKRYVITEVGRSMSGHRIAWLDGKSGFVALEALTPAPLQEAAA